MGWPPLSARGSQPPSGGLKERMRVGHVSGDQQLYVGVAVQYAISRLIAKAEQMGFDLFEVAFEDPKNTDLDEVKRAFQNSKVIPSVCGAFGPGRDISSDDPAIQKQGMEYIATCIEAARAWGSKVVGGPMYACVGKAVLFLTMSEEKNGSARRPL